MDMEQEEPTQPSIAEEIMRNAISSGTRDPRFSPVRKDELDLLFTAGKGTVVTRSILIVLQQPLFAFYPKQTGGEPHGSVPD